MKKIKVKKSFFMEFSSKKNILEILNLDRLIFITDMQKFLILLVISNFGVEELQQKQLEKL